MSRTLSGLFLASAVHRPRKRKRTNRENPRTIPGQIGKIPEKSGKPQRTNKKGQKRKDKSGSGKPPFRNPSLLPALDQNPWQSDRARSILNSQIRFARFSCRRFASQGFHAFPLSTNISFEWRKLTSKLPCRKSFALCVVSADFQFTTSQFGPPSSKGLAVSKICFGGGKLAETSIVTFFAPTFPGIDGRKSAKKLSPHYSQIEKFHLNFALGTFGTVCDGGRSSLFGPMEWPKIGLPNRGFGDILLSFLKENSKTQGALNFLQPEPPKCTKSNFSGLAPVR